MSIAETHVRVHKSSADAGRPLSLTVASVEMLDSPASGTNRVHQLPYVSLKALSGTNAAPVSDARRASPYYSSSRGSSSTISAGSLV